jgi:superfamily I DNA/RNA helicase/mRNA-degrading endonuclease RelE of RelBE toxin-antitoxin system
MDFRIADTFTNSLDRLTGEEQKAVKSTVFDLQRNPSHPSLSLHKLEKAWDSRFASARVSRDIRLILHRSEGSLLLCYVDHHDKAYAWAERRKLETHPKTGAAQFVEIRERVQEIVRPVYVTAAASPVPPAQPSPYLARYSDDELLAFGIPDEWLLDVRGATDETMYAIAEHLPGEASDALLEILTGGTPKVARPLPVNGDPFEHPDAQRRFRVMTNVDELAAALDAPWDRWTIFLHPEQRQLIERDYAGPARVAGSAGTGKTIVALHRAAYLARTNLSSRILLTTYTDTLANALRGKLRRLLAHEPRLAERIDVHSLEAIGLRLYRAHLGPIRLATREQLVAIVHGAGNEMQGHRFSNSFVMAEWEHVVDARQLRTWEEYRDVARLGRKTRLPEAQRELLWKIFELVHHRIEEAGLVSSSRMFTALAERLPAEKPIFQHVVADEAQDLGIAQLRFLGALSGGRPNAAFFAGDLGQRIFQQPFSWKSLGVDVRGRSRTLRVNYRTSHQIRVQADRLLGRTLTDVDGIAEERTDTISVFDGPPPILRTYVNEEEERDGVAKWIAEQRDNGVVPHEIGVFVRSRAQLARAKAAVRQANLPLTILDDGSDGDHGKVALSTMHLAKGLEFRVVAVMACDDEVIPLQTRIEAVGDDADLQEVYETERQLLYVACTRARDRLLVTGVQPASEFLDDLVEQTRHSIQ